MSELQTAESSAGLGDRPDVRFALIAVVQASGVKLQMRTWQSRTVTTGLGQRLTALAVSAIPGFDGAVSSREWKDAMGQVLHGSATTTEAIRRTVQHSRGSLRTLARRQGINRKPSPSGGGGVPCDLPTGRREPRFEVQPADGKLP